MSRPRKDDPQSAATARIEAAFWQLLEEVGYPEITVRRVTQLAGVNRNSFYYHYDSMEGLAREAFMGNAADARSLISRLIAGFRDDSTRLAQPAGSTLEHAKRVMLCARSESPFLKSLVNNMLRDVWLGELGIEQNLLSKEDRAQVEFIFAGLVAVLGGAEASESPLVMARLADSRIGRASLAALQDMAKRQGGAVNLQIAGEMFG